MARPNLSDSPLPGSASAQRPELRGASGSGPTGVASRTLMSTTAQPCSPTIAGLMSSSATSRTSAARRPRSTRICSRDATSAGGAPRKPSNNGQIRRLRTARGRVGARDGRDEEHPVVPHVGLDTARGHHHQRAERRVAHDAEGDLDTLGHRLDQDRRHDTHLGGEVGDRGRHREIVGHADPDQATVGLVDDLGVGDLERDRVAHAPGGLHRRLGADCRLPEALDAIGAEQLARLLRRQPPVARGLGQQLARATLDGAADLRVGGGLRARAARPATRRTARPG